jgi:translation initiation factor IF-3
MEFLAEFGFCAVVGYSLHPIVSLKIYSPLRRGRRKRPKQQPKREHRINHEIRVPQVRLVEIDGEGTNDVLSVKEAQAMARDRELDLVEISGKSDPPVVKILEYTKFLYNIRKQRKAQQANQTNNSMKELRFGPNTDEHDLNFKLKHAEKFLAEGSKLKTYVQFRGRNIIYKDRGREILDKVADHLEEMAKIEMEPKMEGRRMIMIMAPK